MKCISGNTLFVYLEKKLIQIYSLFLVYMSLKSKLLFNSKEKEIPGDLVELLDSIFTCLTSNPYQYEVILSFIDYLVYGRDFKIHIENFIEFFI